MAAGTSPSAGTADSGTFARIRTFSARSAFPSSRRSGVLRALGTRRPTMDENETTEPRQVSRRWWSKAVLIGGGAAGVAALASESASAAPPATAWKLGGNDNVTNDGTNFLGLTQQGPADLQDRADERQPRRGSAVHAERVLRGPKQHRHRHRGGGRRRGSPSRTTRSGRPSRSPRRTASRPRSARTRSTRRHAGRPGQRRVHGRRRQLAELRRVRLHDARHRRHRRLRTRPARRQGPQLHRPRRPRRHRHRHRRQGRGLLRRRCVKAVHGQAFGVSGNGVVGEASNGAAAYGVWGI